MQFMVWYCAIYGLVLLMMEEIPIPNHRLGCFLKPLVKNGGSINSDKPFLNWFSRLAGMVEC